MDAINRLRFHAVLLLKKMRLQLDELVHPKRGQEALEDDTSYAPPPKELAEIEKILQKHRDSEPKLDPRRTMLFHSRPEEHRCNAVTASLCHAKFSEHGNGLTSMGSQHFWPTTLRRSVYWRWKRWWNCEKQVKIFGYMR